MHTRHCFILNEVNLAAFVGLSLLGRPVHLVAVQPLIRPMGPILERIAGWCRLVGGARDLAAISPDLPWVEGWPGRGYYNDIHHRTEAGVNAALTWSDLPPVLADYAYMMRKAVSDCTQAAAYALCFLEWARAHLPVGTWRLWGATPHMALVNRLYWGGEIEGGGHIPFARAWNLFNVVLMAGGTAIWLLRRLGRHVTPEPYHLAADIISDTEAEAFPLLLDESAKVLVVFRTPAVAAALGDAYRRYDQCLIGDVRVRPGTAVTLLGRTLGELAALWWGYGNVDPVLFGRLAMLVGKKAVFGAFFHRYRPKFFWGRDDYSLEHGVRAIEARRHGVTSLGINHGLPINTYIAQWREIDFDIYYSFGEHLYREFYKDAWPAHQVVKAVGNLRLTPERRKRMAERDSKDICFFAMVTPHIAEAVAAVFAVARRFPDRRVMIKMKIGRDPAFLALYQSLLTDMPANIVVVDPAESAYETFLTIGYAITTGSTVSAEAVQFGVKCFVLDVEREMENFYYRNFPTMIVHDGQDLCDRIAAIEAGREHYDFAACEPLIALSCDTYAAIRADLAL